MGLQDTIEMIERHNRLMPNISKLTAILESPEFKKQEKWVGDMARSIQPATHILQMLKSIPTPPESVYKIAALLADVKKNNPFLSDKVLQLSLSQERMMESFAIASKMSSSLTALDFNKIGGVLNGFSASLIQGMMKKGDWNDIDIIDQASETVAINVNKFIDNSDVFEDKNYYELFQSIVTGLRKLLSKASSKKSKEFIMNSIAVFSIFLSCYIYHLQKKESGESTEQIEKFISQSNREDEPIVDMSMSRFSLDTISLRFSVNPNSKVIGVVKKDQRVNVVQIFHKYLFIAYVDKDTQQPYSGFVRKKKFVPVIKY